MTLLIFSNHPVVEGGDTSDVVFTGYVRGDEVQAKGIIQAVQDFIRDDNVLDNRYEDEHKGLLLRYCGAECLDDLQELLRNREYTLWTSVDVFPPKCYVEVDNDSGYFIYVVYEIDDVF